MKDPAFLEKRNRGPAGIIAVMPTPMPPMGRYLVQWFIFAIIVSIFAAYLGSRALPSGADGREIVRITGTVAFVGHGLALVHDSIWFGRRWSTTIKNLVDALAYGIVTGLVFCWLWPR